MARICFETSDPQSNPNWNAPLCNSDVVLRCDEGSSDPIATIHELEQRTGETSRWCGFFSYDLGRHLDETGLPKRSSGLPLLAFAESKPVTPVLPASVYRIDKSPLRSNFTRAQYINAVQQCKNFIADGDVFQINLSQRFTAGLPDAPLAIFRKLQKQNPSLYAAFLDFGDFALICNSPELFLRITPQPDGRRKIVTRPIKGTRPRAAGMESELRDSIKDQAELNMIVDLERNDLGRICEIGTVKVTQPRQIESHGTVYHGVATIEGILRPDITLFDLLRATFPGGSVTGAPKIRAMQIIDALEPVPGGPYCGAIGYFDTDGTIELNVAIRTMIVQANQIHIPVGGGIVADSDPEMEYEETLVKARAMFAALGVTL